MKEIMSTIFEFSTTTLQISSDPVINYIVMLIIGLLAYKIAFAKVGEIGVKGELGSFLHWIIRIVVFITIWAFVVTVISTIKFIVSIPIWVWISLFLLIILSLLITVARTNPKSILNKKII